MKKLKVGLTILTVFAMLFALAGCGGGSGKEEKLELPDESIGGTIEPERETISEDAGFDPEMTEEPTVEESIADGMEFAPEETQGVAMDTPYITLYYPEEWDGLVTTELKTEGETQRLTIRTEIGGKGVELFSLIMGPVEMAEGFPLGTLNHETAGTIQVFAAMNEQMPEGWTDDEVAQFGAMQERVNDLIMQLHEDPRFDAGR